MAALRDLASVVPRFIHFEDLLFAEKDELVFLFEGHSPRDHTKDAKGFVFVNFVLFVARLFGIAMDSAIAQFRELRCSRLWTDLDMLPPQINLIANGLDRAKDWSMILKLFAEWAPKKGPKSVIRLLENMWKKREGTDHVLSDICPILFHRYIGEAERVSNFLLEQKGNKGRGKKTNPQGSGANKKKGKAKELPLFWNLNFEFL